MAIRRLAWARDGLEIVSLVALLVLVWQVLRGDVGRRLRVLLNPA